MNKIARFSICHHKNKRNLTYSVRGLLLFLFIIVSQLSSIPSTSPLSHLILSSETNLQSSAPPFTAVDNDYDELIAIHSTLIDTPFLPRQKADLTTNHNLSHKKWLKPLSQAPPQYG